MLLQRAYGASISALLQPQLRREKRDRLRWVSERLIEYATALRWIAERYPDSLLDVGPGEGVWPRLLQAEGIEVTAIDEIRGYWSGQYVNRHFLVTPGDITRWQAPRQFACVTCISALEHIPDHRAAIRSMFAALADGGDLILTFPFNEHRYYDNVYALSSSSYSPDIGYIAQQYSRRELETWLADTGAELVELELWRVWTGEHWTEGERLAKPTPATRDEPHQLACVRLRRNPRLSP